MVALVVMREDLRHLCLPLEQQNIDNLESALKFSTPVFMNRRPAWSLSLWIETAMPSLTLESSADFLRKLSASCDLSFAAVVISSSW